MSEHDAPAVDLSPEAVEWPREIWLADPHGPLSVVFSAHATIPRYEGDTERDREFHNYVDADIGHSAERYWRERVAAANTRADAERDRADRLEAENERLREVAAKARDLYGRPRSEGWEVFPAGVIAALRDEAGAALAPKPTNPEDDGACPSEHQRRPDIRATGSASARRFASAPASGAKDHPGIIPTALPRTANRTPSPGRGSS